jgi:methyl-accepting chemotaxis protein
VESANLDEANPGLETLSERLRELARSLEERQTSLRRLLDDIKMNYEEFTNSIELNLQKALNLAGHSSTLSGRVDDIISDIETKNVTFKDNAASLERTIEIFKVNLPRSYG